MDLSKIINTLQSWFNFTRSMVVVECPGRTVEIRVDHISTITRTNGSTFAVGLVGGQRIEFTNTEVEAAATAFSECGLYRGR